jgi:hypothetical protein
MRDVSSASDAGLQSAFGERVPTVGFSQSSVKAGTRLAISILALGTSVLGGAACRRSRPVATFSVEPRSVSLPHPHAAPLTLRWRPAATLDGIRGKPRVFVHVLDSGRRLLRTFDHPFPDGWKPGHRQSYGIELYQSAIAKPLPAGAYEMTFGLYDDGGKTRWPLTVEGEEVGRREYRLATLVVPAAPGASPSFKFSGGWRPIEPGSSKQVLARRCLGTDGRIAVVAPPSQGTVLVAASILSAGTSGAGWRVSASCSPETMEVTGAALRWVGFPIAPATGTAPCEIRFTPPPPGGNPGQSLCLEVLAWKPATR